MEPTHFFSFSIKKGKFLLFFSCCFFLILSCSKNKNINPEVNSIEIPFEFVRFDKLFTHTPEAEFGTLKNSFPYLFPQGVSDSVWFQKRNDTLFEELAQETEKVFQNTKKLENDLKSLFQYIKYYYPEKHPGKVIGLISEVDINSRTIYADSITIISLDTYLGKNHPIYQNFDSYLLSDFEQNRITSDVAESFLTQQLPKISERTLLAYMIYAGKIMYGKDLLLPEVSDALKIGYSPEQIDWSIANEQQIWKYFIENKLLYSTDAKLYTRFIQKAPFSKFYLELDSESPGSIGIWLGWQIVRSYMNNNNVSIQELYAKDAKEIFDNSKYKPKK